MLLAFDSESGGISSEYHILSVSFGVVNENFNITHNLDLLLKPDPFEGRTSYYVQTEALEVNKINLIEHDKVAITYKDSKPIIYKWLEEMKSLHGDLVPFGNGIDRDVRLLTKYTISLNSWHNLVSRRVIEMVSIGQFAKMLGKIPQEQSLALHKLAPYFGLEVDEELSHSARYDIELQTLIMREYAKLFGWQNTGEICTQS